MQTFLQRMIFFSSISSSIYGQANIHFESKSFFLTEEELSFLQKFLQSKENIKIEDEKYVISCIFYVDDDNWNIWINNKQYSSVGQNNIWINNKQYNSVGQNEDFSIDEVTQNYVIITTLRGRSLVLTPSFGKNEKQEESD